jgi:7,8-dihydroneopterin aldolase/epimerase/oxygenase
MSHRHTIRLKNAVFYAYHGNMHEERHLGGRFHVDVEMDTDFTAAAASDSLEHTVNYEVLYALIQDVLTEQTFKLIETVAQHIATRVLTTFPMVLRVVVRVRKPGAPVRGVIDYVEAEIDEQR